MAGVRNEEGESVDKCSIITKLTGVGEIDQCAEVEIFVHHLFEFKKAYIHYFFEYWVETYQE